MKNILVIGAKGSIGNYIYNKFKEEKYNVYGTTSKNNSDTHIYIENGCLDNLLKIDNLDSIIWCQGLNMNDNIYNFDNTKFMNLFNVNVLLIIETLNFLLKNNKINNGSKLVIISSIWEKITRSNKLSYTLTKSSLGGLVKSLSYDLSEKNILINNILPGVIFNDMTLKNLSIEQINNIKENSNFDRLVSLDDIYETVKFLTINNNGITGESIKVDLGFSNIKKIS